MAQHGLRAFYRRYTVLTEGAYLLSLGLGTGRRGLDQLYPRDSKRRSLDRNRDKIEQYRIGKIPTIQ